MASSALNAGDDVGKVRVTSSDSSSPVVVLSGVQCVGKGYSSGVIHR